MAGNKSRYQVNVPFYSSDGGEAVFKGYRQRAISAATGIIEYTIKENDRLDLLAHHFYVDSRKWWRILDANPQVICGADLSLSEYIGETIVIPQASEGIS